MAKFMVLYNSSQRATDLMELLKSHPQLKRQGATIDVLEMLSMPGLDA